MGEEEQAAAIHNQLPGKIDKYYENKASDKF